MPTCYKIIRVFVLVVIGFQLTKHMHACGVDPTLQLTFLSLTRQPGTQLSTIQSTEDHNHTVLPKVNIERSIGRTLTRLCLLDNATP
jgi:hypothetical protein